MGEFVSWREGWLVDFVGPFCEGCAVLRSKSSSVIVGSGPESGGRGFARCGSRV